MDLDDLLEEFKDEPKKKQQKDAQKSNWNSVNPQQQ